MAFRYSGLHQPPATTIKPFLHQLKYFVLLCYSYGGFCVFQMSLVMRISKLTFYWLVLKNRWLWTSGHNIPKSASRLSIGNKELWSYLVSFEFSRLKVAQIGPSRCWVVCPYEHWKGPDSWSRGMTTQGRLVSNCVYTRGVVDQAL